jgi:hypothetical protein
LAAACYATPPYARVLQGHEDVPIDWPWQPQDWKPGPDRIRELVKAGALVAAEIDRLRAEALARADHGITA